MLDIYDIIFVITFVIINSILYILTYNWITHMEKIGCECAMTWQKDFIKYYIIFIVTYNIASAIYLIFIRDNIKIAFSVKLFILILDIFFIITTIMYISELKKQKCECSSNIIREVTLIYVIISGFLIGLAISVPIFIILSLYITGKITQKNKQLLNEIIS